MFDPADATRRPAAPADPFAGPADAAGPDPSRDLAAYVPRPQRDPDPPAAGDADGLAVRHDADRAARLVGHRVEEAHLPDGARVVPGRGPWVQTHEAATLSGHKLHVACDDPDELPGLVARLHPLASRYGLGLKFATPETVSPSPDLHPSVHPSLRTPQPTGATVYLPRRATLDRDAGAVVGALAGYACDAEVPGDARVAGPVWHRFDLDRDHGRDLDHRDYHAAYRPAAR